MAKIKLFSIAESPHEQEQGLQFVRSLPEDSGMLFRYNTPRVLNFWMINTYLPLDIAFIDNKGTIVKTETMIPLSTRTVSSGSPCVMALEVAAGGLEKAGAGVGKRVTVREKTVEIE
jgi:hypothetical protein